MGDYKSWAKAFKALSNPNRLELFLNILEQQKLSILKGKKEHKCVISEFICNLNIGAPTISHHIKELVNAGLVITERQGKFLSCEVNTKAIKELREILEDIEAKAKRKTEK